VISVTLPIRTESEANLREHWAKKNRRAQLHRGTARLILRQPQYAALYRHTGNFIITLTRIAPRSLDTDNCANSSKHVQDGIADALGIDDGSKRIQWRYAQEKGKPKEYMIRVDMEMFDRDDKKA
jgi:hypothetical protein